MVKHHDPHDLQKKALNWAYISRGLNRVHDVHADRVKAWWQEQLGAQPLIPEQEAERDSENGVF